jgi:deazaflavin-dependent oxidoreductase (nitroreductase family)
MGKLRNRILNTLLIPLLRSPGHKMVSKTVMLITFTGRKTGQEYRFPVGYTREDDTITIFTRKDRNWWRNLQDGAEVTLRIRGKNLKATATSLLQDDVETMYPLMEEMYPTLSEQDKVELAPNMVMIQLEIKE